MTLSQLEKYMISEIENLHLKIDSAFEMLSNQMQAFSDHMNRRFDAIESRLDTHEARISLLEKG